MKKSPLVLSIVSAILSIAAIALLVFLPNLVGELSSYVATPYRSGLVNNLIPVVIGSAGFKSGHMIYSGVFVGLMALIVIFWIWHLIMLICKKRFDSLVTNLFWLIFGAIDVYAFLAFIGYNAEGTSYVFSGTIGEVTFDNGFTLIGALAKDNLFGHFAAVAALAGILALAGLSLLLGFIGVAQAIHDDRVYPKSYFQEEKEEDTKKVANKDEKEKTKAKKADVKDEAVSSDEEGDEEVKGKKNPLIVQNISYTKYPYPEYAQPYGPILPPPPAPRQEETKEKPLTEESVRKVVAEALAAQQNAFLAMNARKEEPVVEKPVEKAIEERPLTAKELRSIIKNELRDHDHPEELLPLTDEQCRALIRDELDQYYASTRPISEKEEEKPVETKPSEPAKEDDDDDFMTAEELSKMIRSEVVQVIEEQPKEEKLTIEMVKSAIDNALASYQPHVETLTKEDVSEVVKEQLAPTKEAEVKQDQAIISLREQNFSNEYQAKLAAAKNAEAIESLEKSQLSAEDIRKIISDELDKKLATFEPKVVEKVVEVKVPSETKSTEEALMAKSEPEVVEQASDEEKVARIPFANRVMALDDEMKDAYNELKEEAISYGLKSRLSISGDTFRLHTKTYFKIIVAGKGLKLYMALDPHDYKDSTIPVKDAGTKNLYKDIPLVFKIKSPLSLKRAKSLIKDVCEKDGLVKTDVEHFNYVSQLESYRVAGSEDEEAEDEE